MIFVKVERRRTITYFKREFDKKGVNIGVLAGFVLLLSGIDTSSAMLAELDVYDRPLRALCSWNDGN